MKTFDFGCKIKEKLVLCLGHFDGLHQGHLSLIKKANKLSEASGAKVAIFTFDDNFSKIVKGEKSIFTLSERLCIFEKHGIDITLIAKCDSDFLSKPWDEFLRVLFSTYDLEAVICGKDYTFGFKGQGNTEKLETFAKANGVDCFIIDTVKYGDRKISSTMIKSYLESGKLVHVSNLLGYDYFTEGVVIHGVNLGEKLGFPTLNIIFDENKKLLRCGVYKTYTEIDGNLYNSITNFGSAPTFERYNFVIETHVLNFNQNVYGKKVKVYFVDFMRGLIKFNSMEDLIVQLTEDKKVYD